MTRKADIDGLYDWPKVPPNGEWVRGDGFLYSTTVDPGYLTVHMPSIKNFFRVVSQRLGVILMGDRSDGMTTVFRQDNECDLMEWLMFCEEMSAPAYGNRYSGLSEVQVDTRGVFDRIEALADSLGVSGVLYTCIGGDDTPLMSFAEELKAGKELQGGTPIKLKNGGWRAFYDDVDESGYLGRKDPIGFCYNCGACLYNATRDREWVELPWGVCACHKCYFHCDSCNINLPLTGRWLIDMDVQPIVCVSCGFMACGDIECQYTGNWQEDFVGRKFLGRTAPGQGIRWDSCPRCGAGLLRTFDGGDTTCPVPYCVDFSVDRYVRYFGRGVRELGLTDVNGRALKYVGNLWIRRALLPQFYPNGRSNGDVVDASRYLPKGFPAVDGSGYEVLAK